MKMLEIKWEGQEFLFALDAVRMQMILQRPKVRKDPAHHVVRVGLTPTKRLDGEGRGMVVDDLVEYEWRFDSFDDAKSAITVADV